MEQAAGLWHRNCKLYNQISSFSIQVEIVGKLT